MTAPAFLPVNALVAARGPIRRAGQISIRAQEVKERVAAKRAAEAAEAARVVTWQGKTGTYAFKVVTVADREKLNASPVILLAMRRSTGLIAGVKAFEAEDRTSLNAWLDRAAVVSDIALHARFNDASRADRAAVVADLAPKPVPAFVLGGKYDLRAIMRAAHAAAQADRKATGRTWGVCFSAALRDVWQAAKAARSAQAA